MFTVTDTLRPGSYTLQNGHYQLGRTQPVKDSTGTVTHWNVTITILYANLYGSDDWRPVARFTRPTFLQAIRAIRRREMA